MAQKSTEQLGADDATAIARLRATQATKRARRRAIWQRVYQFVNGLFHINGNDFIAFGKTSTARRR